MPEPKPIKVVEEVVEYSKSQKLYRSGTCKFKCDFCKEGYASKKEFERHSKTAGHKDKHKKYSQLLEKYERGERDLCLMCTEFAIELRSKDEIATFTCHLCHDVHNQADNPSHMVKHHGSVDFKSLPHEKKLEIVRVYLKHYVEGREIRKMKELV